EQISLPQVAALLNVVDARLQLGVSNNDYGDVVRHLAEAIRAVHSPAVAEVALDSIEILVNSACPRESDRQAFVADVASTFQRWYRRISQDQMVLLRLLAGEVGIPLDLHIESSELGSGVQIGWTRLEGRRVSLYSLQDSALRRAAEVLTGLCPGV